MINSNEKTLVLFDFDGTITNKDSLFEFLKFSVGPNQYYKKIIILIPVFLKALLHLSSNAEAKERVISYFFYNWSVKKFKEIADLYSSTSIKNIIKKSALEKLEWHKSQNHRIIVVSASLECYLKLWCEFNNLELIGTKLELSGEKISGKFATPNCNYEEKVKRIKEKINLSEFNQIYAYGNSKGDLPMLNLADKKYYNNFK